MYKGRFREGGNPFAILDRLKNMKHQQLMMVGLRTIGYANLLSMMVALFGLKDFDSLFLLFITSPMIALSGTIFYYRFWHYAFPDVDKKTGRVIMRPYILGAVIAVLAPTLVCALSLYGTYHE